MKHYCLTTIATVLILLSLTDSVFPDDIKTIDGNIITGEIVGVDEEYLSFKQGQNNIVFIQWRIVSFISRNKEIITVSHENNRKKFLFLQQPQVTFHGKEREILFILMDSFCLRQRMVKKTLMNKGAL